MSRRYVFIAKDTEVKLGLLQSIKEPIDSVSVGEICAQNHISRQTFYRHFGSKYDIFPWFLSLANSFYLNQIGRTLSWDEGYEGALTMLYDEREHLLLSCEKSRESTAMKALLACRRAAILETLEDYKKVDIDEETSFLLDFYVRTENMLIVDWCLSGMTCQQETFRHYLTACAPTRLQELLRKPSQIASVIPIGGGRLDRVSL